MIVVCSSENHEMRWNALFFTKGKLVYRFKLRARVCSYYFVALEEDHILLLAMEDGTIQTFKISSTHSVTRGELKRIFDVNSRQRGAIRFDSCGEGKVAAVSQRQCALLSISDALSSGYLSLLSLYTAGAASNMAVLKVNLPRELQDNFPYILLVSTVGHASVRVFSFQFMMRRKENIESSGPSLFAETGSRVPPFGDRRGPPTGLIAHLKSFLQRGKWSPSSGFFEPRVGDENMITNLGMIACTVLDGGNESPPFELLALSSHHGFILCVSTPTSYECYVFRDFAIQNALKCILKSTVNHTVVIGQEEIMSEQVVVSKKDVDPKILRLISSKVDALLLLCETDNELRNYALKFKLEQAVDQAAFEAKRSDGEEMLHFQRVLRRMSDLALHIAPHILRRTIKYFQNTSFPPRGLEGANEEACTGNGVPNDVSLRSSSSVEEFCEGSEAWLESGAHLSHAAVELLCLVLVSHPLLLGALQSYLYEHHIIGYLTDALAVSRDHEMAFFQEGYRTEHMRLIANLTHCNEAISLSVVQNTSLLSAILSGTRFDEENPGIVEWAEFTIRNLCFYCSEARERIRRLTPVDISKESRDLLVGKVDFSLSPTGKVVYGNVAGPSATEFFLRMPLSSSPSVLPHRRTMMLATSVEDQEAALAIWRAKSFQDNETLCRISSKIVNHKKKTEVSRRKERWLAERVLLDRDNVVCHLEVEKALLSCSRFFPDEFLNEVSSQENRFMSLKEFLKKRFTHLQALLQRIRQQEDEGSTTREGMETVRELFLIMRDQLAESKNIVDAEAHDIFSALNTSDDDISKNTLDCLTQETMEMFAKVCLTRAANIPTALEQTYRSALQEEGDQALSRISTLQGSRQSNGFSLNDLRTVSLIVKTCDSGLIGEDQNSSTLSRDVYDRIQNSLPHIKMQSARLAVDEVLRQKREKVHMRSVARQYKKRASELLQSFEDAITAHEEIIKMQFSIEEDLKLQEERKKKSDEILECLRAAHDAKRDARLAEEEIKRTEEEHEKQRVLRIREAEFQQRLEKLKQYRDQQRALEENERAVQSAMAEAEALQKALQHEHDLKRVEERKKEYEEKCRLRESALKAVEEIKAARAKVLESFFKSVEKRLGVTRDAERVQKGTASQKGEPFVSLSEAARYNVHGYTIDDVMKDPRFRLQLALVEAGLHQTPYGREVITRGFHVPQAQRPSEDNPLRIEY